MTLSVTASGTQAASIGTEHTLNAPSASNVYQLIVNLENMVNGDVVELRVKRKILSGSADEQTVFFATYAQAPGADGVLAISPPLPCPHGCEATLKQTAGTGRNFDWSLEEYE